MLAVTPGALAALQRSNQTAGGFLARHAQCDWGDLSAEDAKLNVHAVAHEDQPDLRTRVLSAYRTNLGERLWIITEADRSVTTVLLPEDY